MILDIVAMNRILVIVIRIIQRIGDRSISRWIMVGRKEELLVV
jgi:hypothetical protein